MMASQNIFKEIRLKLCFSQQEISDFLGIAQNTYSKYETNKNHPNCKTARHISEKLKEKGIDIDPTKLRDTNE